ncbi:MAG: ParB/RepB/Spo0J family partition protein [Anaerovoracaceae bacterium]
MARKYDIEKIMPEGGLSMATKEEMAKTADLFGIKGTVLDDGSLDRLAGIKREYISYVKLEDIRDFGGSYGKHRFELNKDKVEELAESIRQSGILNPLIIREDKSGRAKYECLAGHTRREAAKLAGLKEVEAIIKDVSDEEAELIMVATNHQREDLLITEKGWIYRIEYEAIKRQGKRKDLTCGQNGHKLEKRKKSLDELAEKSDDSRKQIQRLIRTTYLVPGLADRVNRGKIPFLAAVDLSYLKEPTLAKNIKFPSINKEPSLLKAKIKATDLEM